MLRRSITTSSATTLGVPPIYPKLFNRDKNKFFFFWGQEWLKYHYGETPTLTVPTARMRNGDFSELLGPESVLRQPRAVTFSGTGDADSGQHYPSGTLESERPRLAACLSGSQHGFSSTAIRTGSHKVSTPSISAKTRSLRICIRARIITLRSADRTMDTPNISRSMAGRIARRSSLSGRTKPTR